MYYLVTNKYDNEMTKQFDLHLGLLNGDKITPTEILTYTDNIPCKAIIIDYTALYLNESFVYEELKSKVDARVIFVIDEDFGHEQDIINLGFYDFIYSDQLENIKILIEKPRSFKNVRNMRKNDPIEEENNSLLLFITIVLFVVSLIFAFFFYYNSLTNWFISN